MLLPVEGTDEVAFLALLTPGLAVLRGGRALLYVVLNLRVRTARDARLLPRAAGLRRDA